jgi:hypothetical protein
MDIRDARVRVAKILLALIYISYVLFILSWWLPYLFVLQIILLILIYLIVILLLMASSLDTDQLFSIFCGVTILCLIILLLFYFFCNLILPHLTYILAGFIQPILISRFFFIIFLTFSVYAATVKILVIILRNL